MKRDRQLQITWTPGHFGFEVLVREGETITGQRRYVQNDMADWDFLDAMTTWEKHLREEAQND